MAAVELIAPKHPLIQHKITHLRNKDTDAPTFRHLVDELTMLLSYEATREVRVDPCEVETPLVRTTGWNLSHPRPLVVPILRAGLAMLDGWLRIMPKAEVGFLGMIRDETTLLPVTYAERLPKDLSGRQCYVLDPMLATGGSLGDAVKFLVDRGADHITCITLMSAPEGIEHLRTLSDQLGVPVTLVTSSIEERLNEHGYILPGLGDAGDRNYGLAE